MPPTKKLIPPAGGAAIRMYRIGHGDCFLLAFPGKVAAKPVYVLIDCGYKPGSSKFINTTADKIAKSIEDATGGHIDVAIITHEHQDHVNAITANRFKTITIGETWFAWTEDPADALANDLRKKFKDKLLGLLAARNRLQAAGDEDEVRKIDQFLAFELGGEDEAFNAKDALQLLAADLNSSNKKSMKVFKDKASAGVKFIKPHDGVMTVPNAKNVRVFAMGPPRDPDLLESLDPEGTEEFHSMAFGGRSTGAYFGMAARAADAGSTPEPPFANRYCIGWEGALVDGAEYAPFFRMHYGKDGEPPTPALEDLEAPSNPDWRRIDKDWLYSAEDLALDMSKQTNNSSLVLAFELGKGGKVLLFVADAQRGNWLSWSRNEWKDGSEQIKARDLLSRTVLYKVGHHGSHNATLNGKPTDLYPNLAWMAEGDHAREFTAMITAVRAWAETQVGWDHPLKAIKDALLAKASGRVFQTDTDVANMQKPPDATQAEWDTFLSRVEGETLYFDYLVQGS
jgi:beta-lactamase superfamily II metal-dependent hydrolase